MLVKRRTHMAIDPVCGMEVDKEQAAGRSEYQGTMYYFCALGCKRQFDRDPERYVSARARQGEEPGARGAQ
jgi:YHS domain-containing protein